MVIYHAKYGGFKKNGGFTKNNCDFPSERGDVNRRRCEYKINPNVLFWKECFPWETPLGTFKYL